MEIREINTKKLLSYILRHWRLIFITGIILGVLFGGGKLASGILTWSSQWETFEADLEDYHEYCDWYDAQVGTSEVGKETCREEIANLQTYIDNSVLMSMDATEKMQATATILVSLDASVWNSQYSTVSYDPTDSLLTMYENSITEETDWEKLASVSGVAQEYVSELVGATADLDGNMLTITVSYPDADIAMAVVDEILSEVTARYDEMAATVGAHTLVVTNKVAKTVNDQELLEYQKTMNKELSSYQSSYSDYQSMVDDLEYPSWPTSEPSRRKLCLGAVIFAILGFVLGILAAVSVYYAKYVYTGKLRSADELNKYMGIRCLGGFGHQDEKDTSKGKRAFVGIDRCLEKVLGTDEAISDELAQQIITLNLKNSIGNEQKIFITGSVDEKEFQKVQDILCSEFSELKIMAGKLADKNIESYQAVMDCDKIILVEKLDDSKWADIIKEKEFAESIEKEIIGCVLV